MDFSTESPIVARQQIAFYVAEKTTSGLTSNPATGARHSYAEGIDAFIEIYRKVYQGLLAAEKGRDQA